MVANLVHSSVKMELPIFKGKINLTSHIKYCTKAIEGLVIFISCSTQEQVINYFARKVKLFLL